MTAQFTERLFYRGKSRALCTLPLEPYLDLSQKRALFDDLHVHTACVRRYVGDWAIKEGRLFLARLQTLRDGEFPLDALFPGAQIPVFAHWFSGELRCPQGELFKYVHFDFRSLYERDLYISVNNGVVEAERLVNNPPPPPRDPQEDLDIPDFLKKR